jgi:cytochrome c oxidase subunit 2
MDAHLLLNLWIALGLIALAHLILLCGLAWRRVKAPGLKPDPSVSIQQGPEGPFSLPVSGSNGESPQLRSLLLLEILPLAALTILFAGLGARSEQLWAAQRYTGANPAAMQVEVTGAQFVWTFRYPGADAAFGETKPMLIAPAAGNSLGIDFTDPHAADDIVTSQLVLPAGREVDLTLRSLDVIHGFAVPEMRLKQNAVPGQTSHIHFTPETPGEYAILCTQVCGTGHYRMQAVMRVLPADEFDEWLRMRELRR